MTGQLPSSEAASGVQTGTTAAPAVQTSVTGSTAAPTQAATTTPLADTVSTVSQPSTTTGFDLNAVAQQGRQQSATSLQNLGLDSGVVQAEGSTPFPTSTPAPEQSTGGDWWKGYTSGLGTTAPATTGTETKMGLEDYLKMQGKAQLIGGGIKALGALATAPETQQNRQQLMDLYNQQNAANQYYQNLMQNTYQNPMGYLGSGEAAATRSAALQKALAMNAQAGRRTQGGALANQLMQTQLQNLQNYRRGIPQPQYGTAAQTLNYAQQYSPTADIFGGVASMATPLSLYSLFG